MPELEQIEEVKSAFVQNRKYSNAEKIAIEEEELEQLKAEQRGEVKEEEIVEEEPKSAEERTFKKRYGDLRRHSQKNESDLKERIAALEAQLDTATKKEIRLPKSDDEIEAWAKEYPDVAAIVETIAVKKSKEQQQGIEAQLEQLNEMKFQNAKEKAEVELLAMHPDFAEIRDDDAFHDWAEDQPKWVQDALYENANDARSAARAIDLYKADMEKTSKKKSSSNKEAAKSVNTKGARTSPDSTGTSDMIRESDVEKMSSIEYEANQSQIMDAIRNGKFIYDVSGNAR